MATDVGPARGLEIVLFSSMLLLAEEGGMKHTGNCKHLPHGEVCGFAAPFSDVYAE